MTRVHTTRLGCGTAPIGGLYRSVHAQDATDLLSAAWSSGVRYFDTAPHYGVGLAEERLGAFLASRPRQEFTVSTKIGRLLVEGPGADLVQGVDSFYGTPNRVRVLDYSRDGVLRSVEDSLRRLRLDRIDLLLIHDPDDHWAQAVGEAYPALAELRQQGAVGAIGVGMNQTAMLTRFVQETDVDYVMEAGRCTLLDRTADRELLPLCAQRGVSVLAAGVFNSGILADPQPGAPFDYAPAPEPVLRRAQRLRELCDRYDVPLAAAALQFPLRRRAVVSVVVGAHSADQFQENARLAELPVPQALWEELEEFDG